MPVTHLRVSGSTAKIRRFLRVTKLAPCYVYWKGEPRNPGSKVINKSSGFNVLLSDYDGKSFRTRVRLVSKFLSDHRHELEALKAMKFRSPMIDFGLYDNTPSDRMWPMYRIPASFIQLLTEFGFELELSFYGQREDEI